MIHFITGSIWDSDADVIVVPVNCRGVAGAGMALQARQRHPKWYLAYTQACKDGEIAIGFCHLWQGEYVNLLSFPTKDDWRRLSEEHYISSGLKSMMSLLSGFRSVALPPLGCGLGRLDPKIIVPMMVDALEQQDIEAWIYGAKLHNTA